MRLDSGKSNYSKKGAGVYFKLKSVKIANGDWVGVPRRIELEEKAKGKMDRSAEISNTMARCVAEKVGFIGGRIPWSEIRASYMTIAGVGESTANGDVTRLPKGRKKAAKTGIPNDIGGLAYVYLWYEKKDGKTSPIYVSIEPQPTKIKDENKGLFDGAK